MRSVSVVLWIGNAAAVLSGRWGGVSRAPTRLDVAARPCINRPGASNRSWHGSRRVAHTPMRFSRHISAYGLKTRRCERLGTLRRPSQKPNNAR
jgi:hypothetical protein